MLNMSFASFLLLAVISVAAASAYHFALRMRFLEGLDAFFGKVLIGWLGAWLGSPVFGHWLWKYENIYVVPAILGAIAIIHLNMLGWRAVAHVVAKRTAPAEEMYIKKAA